MLQVGGFFAVAIAILGIHLLREQVLVSSSVGKLEAVQDPRKMSMLFQIRRGSIYAHGRVVATNQASPNSRYVRRIYPEPNLSYLAGYYSPRTYGLAGLEASLDSYLSGDASRGALADVLHRPIEGKNVYLTIDPGLQDIAQTELGERKGAIVVLDVQSGAILAMASWPHVDPQQIAFDPNADDWDAETRRTMDYFKAEQDNADSPFLFRPTQGLYPPGSTYKTVTAAAALDTHLATADSMYPDKDGTLNLGAGPYVHRDCDVCHPGDKESFTLTEGYARSLNVVFAQLGVQLGAPRTVEYAHRFGLDSTYDISLPVEASTLLSDTTALRDPDLLAATSYGQGQMLVTPLQMALVAATVARDGSLPEPYLVESITDPGSNNPSWKFQPHSRQQSIQSETAEQLRKMMVTSVEVGFAEGAAIEGYTVGGKTGTAETSGGEPHAWFIGWAGKDIDHPRFAISVIIEHGVEGSTVAVPPARAVLQRALQGTGNPSSTETHANDSTSQSSGAQQPLLHTRP
ncbi:MAG TPA: penicillin-binding protein 2 [Chloroflexia bacterium]|nr:penicillin-binding protein 2 [Chloroflexia bacterium]